MSDETYTFADIVMALPNMASDIMDSDIQPEVVLIVVLTDSDDKTTHNLATNACPHETLRLLKDMVADFENSLAEGDRETVQ